LPFNKNGIVKKSILNKVFVLVIVLVTAASFTGCSKKTYSHNYHAKSRGTAATIDPISSKDEPVRKNYIVPKKSKKILGQEKPHL
jgi:uncharacterized lipoprotein YehR (DUF1307 family)